MTFHKSKIILSKKTQKEMHKTVRFAIHKKIDIDTSNILSTTKISFHSCLLEDLFCKKEASKRN